MLSHNTDLLSKLLFEYPFGKTSLIDRKTTSQSTLRLSLQMRPTQQQSYLRSDHRTDLSSF